MNNKVALVFSGRVRYKFASFWNRNHALRTLLRATKTFHERLEAEKKVYYLLSSFFLYMIILENEKTSDNMFFLLVYRRA